MAVNKRTNEESKEKLDVIANDAPKDKYQEEQQVAKSTGFKVESGQSKFIPEKEKMNGSTLKQEVAASVIKDASMGGSLSGDGVSFAGLRSSGSVGGVLGAANATPVAGQARSNDRTSKKLDRNSTKLNFIPSDQVLVEWDESKPLADAANADQGFNGTYRNEFARLQKNKEAVPGALMFDRSLDMLVKDNIYFGQGQKVSQSGVTTDEDLRTTAYIDSNGVLKYPSGGDGDPIDNYDGGITDNYLNKSVDILLSDNGSPVYTIYNEEKLTCSVDQYEANKSSAQNHILMNDAELVRETMDAKAGDEKADIWTPLARAVMKPTQVVGFLRDMEAEIGNEAVTAYRKFSTSMSYQINRSHKDGQDAKQPAIEALCGLNYNYISKEAAAAGLGTELSGLFTRTHYVNGDASTMIGLYDSIAKYNTKADVLVQPRSFRMHLQTADNNMDPLHTSKLFNQVYDVEETFSTIDREYDPMAPVCLTDKAAVVHRLSWHKLGSYIHNHVKFTIKDFGSTSAADSFTLIPATMVNELKDGGYDIYLRYPTEDLGSITVASNVFTVGTNYEFANATNFEMIISKDTPASVTNWSLVKLANANIVADTAVTYDGRASSSHLYQVIAATLFSDSSKIYANKGGPLFYLYMDLRNKYNIKVAHPLLEGFDKYLIESIGAKYYSLIVGKNNEKIKLPSVNITTIHSTMYFSLWSIMLCAAMPWIVKERINAFRDVLYYEKNVEYPFSSTLIPVRDITTKSYTNFGYVNYDTELEVKRMTPATALNWMLPELYQQVGYASSLSKVLMPWYTNQIEIRYLGGSYKFDDDASAMSFPSIRSGVRLGCLDNLYGMTEKDVRLAIDKIASFKNLSPTLGSSYAYKYSSVGDGQMILAIDPDTMTATNIMKLPRELGFFFTAPYGVLTPKYDHSRNMSTSVLGTSSFRAYYWFGPNAISTGSAGTEKILNAVSINVNRAQNFVQTWYCVLASGTIPSLDHGFFLSANQAFTTAGALLAGRTSFYPYASLADEVTGGVSSNMNKMRSLQKVFWTKIQKLPFILSPFDGLVLDNSDSPNSVVLNDPYDYLYYFGLGGFRASDFRESVYNREKQVINQGTLFVADPWVIESPIFKEGSVTSGIHNSKGYEL